MVTLIALCIIAKVVYSGSGRDAEGGSSSRSTSRAKVKGRAARAAGEVLRAAAGKPKVAAQALARAVARTEGGRGKRGTIAYEGITAADDDDDDGCAEEVSHRGDNADVEEAQQHAPRRKHKSSNRKK